MNIECHGGIANGIALRLERVEQYPYLIIRRDNEVRFDDYSGHYSDRPV
jgi:hypothetical protein